MIKTGKLNMDKDRRNEIKEVVFAYLSRKINNEEALQAATERATYILLGMEAKAGSTNSNQDLELYTAVFSSLKKFDKYRAQINQDFFDVDQNEELLNAMLMFIRIMAQNLFPKLNNIFIEWVVLKQGVFEQYRVQDLDLQTIELTEIPI